MEKEKVILHITEEGVRNLTKSIYFHLQDKIEEMIKEKEEKGE